MASRDKLRPTPPPQGPALVRPVVGVLLLALGGAADVGCAKKGHNVPPMPDPRHSGYPPMQPPPDEDPVPPMPPPDDAPMPPPDEGPVPPMSPPMPPPDDAPMPNPG